MPQTSNQPNSVKSAPSAEQLLHSFTERLRPNPRGWHAVVLNFSRLKPESNRTRRQRIAANALHALAQRVEGHVLALQQGDLVFLCNRIDAAALNAAIGKARNLVADEPLSALFDEVPASDLAIGYELARDFVKFAAYVQQVHAEEQRRLKRPAPSAGAAQKELHPTADPRALAELVMTIASNDFVNLLRRRSVCGMAPGEPPKPIYRELYVSIPDLRNALLARGDIASDRWMFQYLASAIDKRVLAVLRRTDDSSLTNSFSVKLNLSTLLSPDFEAFDQGLRPGTRGSIVVELDKVDVFGDLGAYLFARDSLHERGYRLCLDGVSALALPFIDRERLGLDLVKLSWAPDLIAGLGSEQASELRQVIDKIGKSRIILAGCVDAESVQFGLDRGLRLFQGKYIDRLLGGRGGASAGRAKPAAAAAG